MTSYSSSEARRFAEEWLPAWSGNRPEFLASFYSDDAFYLKWRARIPVGARQLDIVGVCLVQLNAAGKIRRNEVYFDRNELLVEIAKNRTASRLSQAGQR